MSDAVVWLGTPSNSGGADVADAFVSKIGGKAVLLRECTEAEKGCPASFKCPKCRGTEHVSLLAQLYAPLECYDRVLYILTCSACGVPPGPRTEATAHATAPPVPATKAASNASGHKKGTGVATTSFCFAVRSQNFNRAYYHQLVQERRNRDEMAARANAAAVTAAAGGAGGRGLLFAETDDWGGGEDWGSDAEKASAHAGENPEVAPEETADQQEPPLLEPQEAFALAPKGALLPLKGRTYTDGLSLDLFVEPQRREQKFGSVEQQLEEVKRRYGDEAATIDATSFEEDDETPGEKVVRKYMERIEQFPSQCVRWCPDGEPLRACLMPLLQPVPPCPRCRAPRRFECQLTAPTVYFLTRGIGESNNTHLHFSNVLVFTCSKNCNGSADGGYVREHAVVEDEI